MQLDTTPSKPGRARRGAIVMAVLLSMLAVVSVIQGVRSPGDVGNWFMAALWAFGAAFCVVSLRWKSKKGDGRDST
jgi:hypothetical protein